MGGISLLQPQPLLSANASVSASIREEPAGRHRVKPFLAEHPYGKSILSEQRQERVIQNVEAAGETAERGDNEPALVADEAWSTNAVPVDRQSRCRMKMAGNFVSRLAERRFMDELQSAGLEACHDFAAGGSWDFGIMVSGHPDPAAIVLNQCQDFSVFFGHPVEGSGIMKAVAEGDHRVGIVFVENAGEPQQRFAGIVRW